METYRLELIKKCLTDIPFVKEIASLENKELNIEGRIAVHFAELSSPLEFKIVIYPQYPFRSYDSESIKFYNPDLMEYKHVMGDGQVCIHTSDNADLRRKLAIDLEGLKEWVIQYYIGKREDTHYEHLIALPSAIDERLFAHMFTDVDYQFKKNEYGFVNLSLLGEGKSRENNVISYITTSFADQFGKELTTCKWSSAYKNMERSHHGLFFFSKDPPATHGKFLFTNWESFQGLFTQDFLEFLHHCEKEYIRKKRRGQFIPLYIGYSISESDIHWQIATLRVGSFPIEGIKNNKKWITSLTEGDIAWSISKNSSYEYFFGRGAFSENLTTKKILIVGIGAVGSIVAKTLTKCGCRKIDFCDHDRKDPENVSRSEFMFGYGITDKVEELSNILSHISPFVEIGIVNQQYFEVLSKIFFKDQGPREKLENFLNEYDLIFDCSTDNDLMYVLESLNLKGDLINLSISNRAKDLVCAFYPNIYNFVKKQFNEILDPIKEEELHNPIGCWNPTFKASYNDINVLVQLALRSINGIYLNDSGKDNFVLSYGQDETTIEISRY